MIVIEVTDACAGCLECERFLPGFISESGGRQVVTEYWAGQPAVRQRIGQAIKNCPHGAIVREEL